MTNIVFYKSDKKDKTLRFNDINTLISCAIIHTSRQAKADMKVCLKKKNICKSLV